MTRQLRCVAKYGSTLLALFVLATFFAHLPGEPWLDTAKGVAVFGAQAFVVLCAALGLVVVGEHLHDRYRESQ